MKRLSVRLAIGLLLTFSWGCERLEAPTQAQCESALKNSLSVYLGTANAKPVADGKKQDFLDRVKRAVKKGASGVAFSAFKLTDDYKRLLQTCQSDWSVHVTQCLNAGKNEADFTQCKNWPWDEAPKTLPN